MAILGGITDVPGASENVEIQDLARYAVEDHNQKQLETQNDTLQYLRVISAKQQVVKGINYFITLEARRGGLLFVYETKVWVFTNIKQVLEFNPVVVQQTLKPNANLVFVRAIHAKKQVVQGFNYFITLEAKDGDSKNVYVTKVWEFLSAKHLLEFYALLDNGTTVTETGQIFHVPPGSIEIENVARFAVDQYNKKEVLGTVLTLKDDLLKRILPFVVSGLQPGVSYHKAGSLMIIGLLGNKAALSPKLLISLIRSVAEVARREAMELSDLYIISIVSDILPLIKSILFRDLAGVILELSKEFHIEKFLRVLSDSLIDCRNIPSQYD
ncbi:unnamed protein product [Sphenostylis stenocarpa]|uniref:Cysteine proteinase inhibitor n=1 Tax=Sphenostylis stenocarpa TaxID=92480 RepID=A0AA86SRJ9_9FABA|nr:unnamed protein product [Sphenostylis stenocarpa]